MLVSASVTPRLRAEVLRGDRPRPEFLKLEADHGVRLLDWSALDGGGNLHRGAITSLRQVRVALRSLPDTEVVLTDGEHLGIPLGLAMTTLRNRVPHLMIGHHLTTRAKTPFFRVLHADLGIDRIVVHSDHQLLGVRRQLGLTNANLALVPYGVDTEFWQPQGLTEEALIVAPGREHRDQATLAEAVADLPGRLFVSDLSLHNPGARRAAPLRWAENVERGTLDFRELRHLYARAEMVVVPLLEADFPAGVTTVLEAMAMGKPVVVSATQGLDGLVRDGETGVLVPVGDAPALGAAVRRLRSDRAARHRIGQQAREEAVACFGMDLYAQRLSDHLTNLAARPRARSRRRQE